MNLTEAHAGKTHYADDATLEYIAMLEQSAASALNGEGTNPRWLLWEVWHGDNPNMRPHDFIIWINARWFDWHEETSNTLEFKTKESHQEFDKWLLQWVRREIVSTVKTSEEF